MKFLLCAVQSRMKHFSELPVFCLILLFPGGAQAHGLHAKVETRGQQLRLEAWYDDDTPAEKAKVRVVQHGKMIREGLTDERGLWHTELLPAGKYVFEVDGGAGHRTEVELVVEDDAATATGGKSREEVSQQKWIGVIIGLGLILLLSLGGKAYLRKGPEAK